MGRETVEKTDKRKVDSMANWRVDLKDHFWVGTKDNKLVWKKESCWLSGRQTHWSVRSIGRRTGRV
jgi:hypothetical protein